MLSGVLEIAYFLWPITLLLIVHAVASLVLSFRNIRLRYLATLLLPFCFPVLIIFVGYFFWHSGTKANAPIAPMIAANLLLISQILFCFYLIYRSKEVSWFTAAVVLIAVWLGLISSFITGMALTNVWL